MPFFSWSSEFLPPPSGRTSSPFSPAGSRGRSGTGLGVVDILVHNEGGAASVLVRADADLPYRALLTEDVVHLLARDVERKVPHVEHAVHLRREAGVALAEADCCGHWRRIWELGSSIGMIFQREKKCVSHYLKNLKWMLEFCIARSKNVTSFNLARLRILIALHISIKRWCNLWQLLLMTLQDMNNLGADDSIKEPVDKSEPFRMNNEENEVIEPSKPLDDYADLWRENEEDVVIGANNIRAEVMEDNQPTFDDFWVEILEPIHLQQEPRRISPRNNHVDSDVEIHFPDEESLTSVGLDNINKLNFDESNDVEAEISLPNEDNLISIYDMIVPCSNSGSCEANKVTSNFAIDIRSNSNSEKVAKRDDRSKRLHLNAQRHPDLSELLPYRLICDQAYFPPLFSTPDIISYRPSLKSFSQSDIHLPHHTKTDNSVSQYSLSQQPNIFPQRPNHLLLSDPMHLLTVYDLDAMQFSSCARLQKQAIFEGFGSR